MGDEDRPRLISEFCKVTGADQIRAEQYLSATGWDYNVRIINTLNCTLIPIKSYLLVNEVLLNLFPDVFL